MLKNKKIILVSSFLILTGGGAFAYYQLNNKSYEQNESGEYVAEEVESLNSPEESASTDESRTPEPPKTTSNYSAASLLKPTGNFVSSHNVQANSAIESVCVTTPGAKCKIVLTMGGTTKVLNEKTTDSEGVTAWMWQPKKIGISSGSWEIKAVATLGNQSKESFDAKRLEVSP